MTRTGWSGLPSNPGVTAGILAALGEMLLFFALVHDVAQPWLEMFLVGIPIGLALGATVWYAIESRHMSHRGRLLIGLLLVLAFGAYVVGLNLYLGSRT